MNEIFIILNKGTVYKNLYFLRLGVARNYIMFNEPESNWKEIDSNCFINLLSGKKMEIITLKLKGDLDRQLKIEMMRLTESWTEEYQQTPQPINKGYRVVQNMFFSPVKPIVKGGENLTKQEALDLAKKLNYEDDDVYVNYEALDLQDKVVYND